MSLLRNRQPFASHMEEEGMLHEINVTPFVDVMLVLLIIFMVTAPLMTVGVPVDLPDTKAAALHDQVEPIVISLDKEGNVYIQDAKLRKKDFLSKLSAITKNNKGRQLYIRGDKNINYGNVMKVMGDISAAGYTHISLLAENSGG